jgi:hypothetical protein
VSEQAPKWASNADPAGELAIALAARANALEEEQGEWTWRDIAETVWNTRAASNVQKTQIATPGADALVGAHPVFAYLLGEGELEGVWFGDPLTGKPAYWWREHLRAALSAIDEGRDG